MKTNELSRWVLIISHSKYQQFSTHQTLPNLDLFVLKQESINSKKQKQLSRNHVQQFFTNGKQMYGTNIKSTRKEILTTKLQWYNDYETNSQYKTHVKHPKAIHVQEWITPNTQLHKGWKTNMRDKLTHNNLANINLIMHSSKKLILKL